MSINCIPDHGRGFYRKLSSFVLLTTATILLACAHARAENPRIQFNIPSQNVRSALIEFAERTDLSLVYDVENLGELTTNPVDGLYSHLEALEIMLGDTGLIFEKTGEETIAIKIKK